MSLSFAALRVVVDGGGRVSFLLPDGKALLAEEAFSSARRTRADDPDAGSFDMRQSWRLDGDAGDGYGYENGEFSEIPLAWNDGKRTLTIGERRGAYPGMAKEREFVVRLPGGASRRVSYKGDAVVVELK